MKLKSSLCMLAAGILLSLPPGARAAQRSQEIVPIVNKRYLPTLLDLIGGARKSIDFIQLEWQYKPEVKRIQEALAAAVKRGVKVRGLIENRIEFNPTSVKYLRKLGVDAKLDTPEKMTHNKLFIVDGETVLLGSTNITQNSMERNNETNVLIRDPAVGRFFTGYFNQLWFNSAKEPSVKPFSSGDVDIVVNREYFDRMLSLFNGAKGSIKVLLYGMSYSARNPRAKSNRLVDALVAAAKRGVDVRVILDKSDYNDFINRVNERAKERLEAGGVKVRFDDEHVTSHAKLILVDGTVVVGSYNWGYDALERRNEDAVIIRGDGKVTDFFTRYFDTLWEGKPWRSPAAVRGAKTSAPANYADKKKEKNREGPLKGALHP